jgi:hypothetical protein
MRALAVVTADAEVSAIMLKLAEEYDKLADRAEICGFRVMAQRWRTSVAQTPSE